MEENMLRKLSYDVKNKTKTVEPASKQWAGIQYEDNATHVEFDLSEVIAELVANGADADSMLFKINYNSGASGFDPSENLNLVDGKISRPIGIKSTQFGGEITITAEITVIDSDNNARADVYSFPVGAHFTPQPRDNTTEDVVVENISAAEKAAKEYSEKAEEQSAISKEYSELAKGYSEEALEALKDYEDLKNKVDNFEGNIDGKADKTYVDAELEKKASKTELEELRGEHYSSVSFLQTELATKPSQYQVDAQIQEATQGKADRLFGATGQYGGFEWDGTIMTAVTADTKPTKDSKKLITSGGVYEAIGDIETALDGIIAIQNNLIGGDAE